MSFKDLILLIFTALMLLIASVVTGSEDSVIEIKESSSLIDTQTIANNAIVKDTASDSSPSASKYLDINSASLDELISLTGIGPTIAERILKYRELHGSIKSMGDLIDIKGIGPKVNYSQKRGES